MNIVEKVQASGLVLDGAMSTALEHLGINTNNNLWTAEALVNNLDKIYQVHWNYFQAGAQLTITDTYQANIPAFIQAGYTNSQAKEFIANAVNVAKKARNDFENATGKHNFVAGTIGSYGAYLADGSEYRGNYDLSKNEILDFHLPRLQIILKQQPDCIAIETQPQLFEVKVLLDWMKSNAPKVPIYVSFTMQDLHHLSNGTSLQEAAALVNTYEQVFAVGVNCLNPDWVLPIINQLKTATTKEIVVYPNLGSSYDPISKTWKTLKNKPNFHHLAEQWYIAGAHLIGGCCTTGVDEVAAIADVFTQFN